MELNPQFIKSLEGLPGCDAQSLVAALDAPSPVSVRFNPYKVTEKPDGRRVPWCRYGYYLPQRPAFTLDPALHGGAYYVQEAGSMFVEHLLREAFAPEGCEGLRVLDMCASPGGKTTLLSTLVGLEGVVVSNETVRQRVGALTENVIRWGLGNVVVTHNDPAAFAGFNHVFDAVLVDAPCSGEGMMRKNDRARSEWSPGNVLLCAARQRRILAGAWNSLRPGGVLIYSTCTFNRMENEDNVAWMAGEFGCEGVAVDADPSWGIVCGEVPGGDGPVRTFRFYPGKTCSEGFFAAVLRKPEAKLREKMPAPRGIAVAEASRAEAAVLSHWMEQPGFMRFYRVGDNFYGCYAARYPFMKDIATRLTAIHSGVPMGQIFHGKLRPEHSLALFTGLAADAAARANLDMQQAVAYLKKQNLDPALFREGINLVCSGDLPIGWAKRIGARVNNLYPKESMILSDKQ